MSILNALLLFVSFSIFAADEYTDRIKPIFDNRCVACHSCNNAPCQLNLQTYEGFDRGASQDIVYDGTRSKSLMPTRMHIDAASTQEWRMKKFYTVNTSQNLNDNILAKVLALKDTKKTELPKIPVAESHACPDKAKHVEDEIAMPYGLPAIKPEEKMAIDQWIQKGGPGPTEETLKNQNKIAPKLKLQITDWEKFFNQKDLKHQLVSRYLYEHLFLAHIHFESNPSDLFRLVRSKTNCSQEVIELATRRPNEDPGMKDFFYCFKKLHGAMVTKTHIPFTFSPKKKARFNEIFFKPKWKVETLPSFENTVAENPFVAFKDIPVKSRYQFLLDDAQYHLNTFIKGPVCNGSQAVNSIQEQFYVFFMDPESDNMVTLPLYEKLVREPLMLPGVWGGDIETMKAPKLLKKIVDHREAYRNLRAEWVQKIKPNGYKLNDIWDGDKTNPNAFLTVFRHDDNAVVLQGAVGDISKTVFMLDYPLMERLVYNLVVNFDVFGNIGHQLLTRVYMDLIRMEAEEMFLAFLPPEERIPLRKEWYKGFFAEAKLKYIFPIKDKDLPTLVKFKDPKNSKQEMIQQVLFSHLNPKTRSALDPINLKRLETPAIQKRTAIQEALHKVASLNSEVKYKFPQFFPEVSYLLVKTKQGATQYYTIIKNREHENISWIMAEDLRLAPIEDTLTIREGYAANYPNMIFDVDESQLEEMTKTILRIQNAEDFKQFAKSYGVSRTAPEFWSVYDELHVLFKKKEPIEFGYLDLTRYSLEF